MSKPRVLAWTRDKISYDDGSYKTSRVDVRGSQVDVRVLTS